MPLDPPAGSSKPVAPVATERKGALGIITLNRPQALNALNLAMIGPIEAALAAWAADPGVAAVLIRGAGGRAFCAGGDVRAVYQAGQAARQGTGDGRLTRDFFRAEYRLNWAIHSFGKPYVALLDGLAMGGGLGLSVHGSHRVVTERAALAMPETGIGLFPDVGAGWFLNRTPGALGTYLALTGATIGAADALDCGLATHFVPAERIAALCDSLAAGLRAGQGADAVDAILGRFTEPAAGGLLGPLRAGIDRCFAFDTVEEILACLAGAGEWGAGLVSLLAGRSPTSLKVSLSHLRRARPLDYPAIATLDYRVAQACMAGHDFYEGIRALLIDKDRRPAWRPAALEAVGADLVERHFAAPPDGDLVVAPGERDGR